MRILAIRGHNLASIPEFELDLSAGVLADTRIFAITGPTGAGKSTLLDAMCLGLYDRAPRLFGSRDVPVGELGISALDPRSVMRRGAADAHAEVDFLGKDGQRFRAIWEVWRAHKKSDGKIQNQRMRLVALDSGRDVSGATKTETQKLIEEKVGLSFGEFRRAVLLAQGDFASFLRAKPDERAELLERMTGTEIYAQLSRAAFARARQEDERLRELEMKRSMVIVLGDEDAANLREAIERVRAERTKLEERTRDARAALDWSRARERMRTDRDRAIEELASARHALEESAPLVQEIERVAEAEKLRAPLEGLRALERAHQRAASSQAEAQQNLDDCRRLAAEAFEAAAESVAERSRAEELRDRMQPELERARRLDVQIDDARALTDEASKRALEAKKHARHLEQVLEKALEDLETRESEARALEPWFEANSGAKVLAAQWPRWQRELERYAAAAAQEHEAKEKEASLAAKTAELGAALAALAEEKDELARARVEADREIDRAKAELETLRKEVKPVELKAAMDRIGREQASIDAMQTIARETQRLSKHAAEAIKIAKAEAKLAHTRTRDAEVARERRALIEEELSSVAKRLLKMEAELDLAGRRADLLIEGEPCPLCGSTEHPARSHRAPELTALEKERERRTALEEQRERTSEEIAAADDAGIEHGRSAANAESRAAEIASDLEAKKQDWMRRREALALVWIDSPLLARRQVAKIATLLGEVPPVRGGKKELERAAAELMAHAETIRKLAEKNDLVSAALEAARTAQDELTRRSEAAAPRFEEIERKKAELSHALEEIRNDARNAAMARAEAETTLAQPLERRTGWKAELARDPAGMIATLTAEVSAWNANEGRAVDQRRQIVELSQKTELHLAEADRARRDRAKADAVSAERLAKKIALERARAVLLSARSVEDVQQEIAERLREAAARAHEAENRHALANQALAAAEERLEHASDLMREASSSGEEHRARMDAAIAASPFSDLEELERSLQHERGWLEAQRTRIRALEEELTRKEAALADRQHRLEAHEEVKPSGDPEDLAALELEHQRALETFARLQEKSAADDTARRSLTALAPEISRQQQSLESWSEMNALIGSADGKKFRTFAQGLTLDLLLDQANHHLAQLRPRYRLARVPGWDMELEVVDGDMGEEARPVGTLSGGETFLVSLALALGLSSLSSKNVKIESLFIDEGFGHLDRDSLDVALSTLDQLQAEGRTIALISHVPDIAERIGYQVRVEPKGPGRSEVRVVAR